MHTVRLTSSTHEQGVSSAPSGATIQGTRWRDSTCSTVDWDYPPSPAAHYNTLLSRGASHSRFLRIAYLSTRERSSTSAPSSLPISLSPTPTSSPLETSTTPAFPPTPLHLTSTTPSTSPPGSHWKHAIHPLPVPPHPLSRPCGIVRPRSANPPSHTLKRRKPQWPKPPHYHALLLRSPLSRRKGLFRAVLPPNKAVDFFRWDMLLGARVSFSAPRQERGRTRASVDVRASLHVAEFVLEPYEAAAGFFGWHGLGLDVIRRVDGSGDQVNGESCWTKGVVCRPRAGKCRSSDLHLEIDEAAVDEGRARWSHVAEDLVGPPGLVLRWLVEHGNSGKVVAPLDPGHKDGVGTRALPPMSSSREEIRWDPGISSNPFRSSRPVSASDEKRQPLPSGSAVSVPGSASGSKPEPKADLPSAWWYGPPHRGPPPAPHLPSFRFPPPPPVQYGPPPLQLSPYFPGGRATSAQGHGYWYGAQPIGAPSANRDPNLAKSLAPHSHMFPTPVTPALVHPSQSPRHPIKPSLGQDEYGPGHDCDQETETDHGYESATTTTDSDPPPHTPIGAATTSHCMEPQRVHGDDGVGAHGVEIDEDHAARCVTIGVSDPSTPVKFLGRFTMSPSPPMSSGSPDPHQAGYESPKAAVVFPSLNGSFRQVSRVSVSLSSQAKSTQMAPAGMATPASSSSRLSTKEMTPPSLDDEERSEMQLKSGGSESACSVSGDNPAFMLSLCSPPPSTSPGAGFRKDSQGFWEPVMPASPCSSSSSLPLSPTDSKIVSRPTGRWIGEKRGPVSGESSESSEAASSQFTPSAKSRSLSPGPRRVMSADSTCSSNSRPTSFPSPTTTPASASVFGGSNPSSPSPPNNPSLVPSNPTTLLPAFLATATVKRKKASRTREIVDRLKSSSIDAGNGGVGTDGSGWLASPSAGGESEGTLGKTSTGSEHATGSHVAGQSSQSSPPTSSSDSTSWTGSDSRKNYGLASGTKSSESGSSGSGVKSNGTIVGSETLDSLAASRTVATTAKPSITPFPILSVSQPSASNYTVTHSNPASGATVPSNGADGSKMNATAATSPNARHPGPQLLSSTPKGGTSPSTHPPHHPLPSPSHPTVHPQPALGLPPPMVAVSAYPQPMYVPFTQYRLAPPHQGPQGQGAWVAVYPGRPAHLPVHTMPTQTHVPPITGVSGMRHVSW